MVFEIKDAQRLVSALSEVFEFDAPINGYGTINVKQIVNCIGGKVIHPQKLLIELDEELSLYMMTQHGRVILPLKTERGPFTFNDLVTCVMNDESLLGFIDVPEIMKSVRAIDDGRKKKVAAVEGAVANESPVDAQEIIEHLTSVLPEKYVVPNNKLTNTLTKGIIDIGKITLEESRRGAKNTIETTCILTYEGDNVHLTGRQPFTEYDRNVYNAVSSLYVYGDESHNFTPAMVYRAMTGMRDTEKPTAQQVAAVTRSLDKMRFIRARIDCTEELRARRVTLNSKQINGGEIDTYLLAADVIKLKTGGRIVTGYHILKTPILYEYAAAVKQVLTLPAEVLDVKELDSKGVKTTRSLPNTEKNIVLKGYLIRRIEGMKGKNALRNRSIALYDYQKGSETQKGLFSIVGYQTPDRAEAKRIRTDAEKMLSYWVAIGYIKAFEIVAERKKITGYQITV